MDLDGTMYEDADCRQSAETSIFQSLTKHYAIGLDGLQAMYEDAKRSVKLFNFGQAASHSRLLYILRLTEMVEGRSNGELALRLESQYWKTFLDRISPNPGLHEFLASASSAKRRIVIISDLTAEIQIRKLIRLGVWSKIDYLVTSEESGRDKPAINSFALALQKTGLSRERAVFVGNDTERDGLGAKTAGIRFVLYSQDKAATTAQLSVRNFWELNTLIASNSIS